MLFRSGMAGLDSDNLRFGVPDPDPEGLAGAGGPATAGSLATAVVGWACVEERTGPGGLELVLGKWADVIALCGAGGPPPTPTPGTPACFVDVDVPIVVELESALVMPKPRVGLKAGAVIVPPAPAPLAPKELERLPAPESVLDKGLLSDPMYPALDSAPS